MSREILIRSDGAVFPYHAQHAARPNFYVGVMEDDGSVTAPAIAADPNVRKQIAKDLAIPEDQVHPSGVPIRVPAAVSEPAGQSPVAASHPLSGVDDVLPSPNDEPPEAEAPATKDEAPDIRAMLDAMTKERLEAYCRETFGVELDRRRNKADLIAQIEALAKTATKQ